MRERKENATRSTLRGFIPVRKGGYLPSDKPGSFDTTSLHLIQRLPIFGLYQSFPE